MNTESQLENTPDPKNTEVVAHSSAQSDMNAETFSGHYLGGECVPSIAKKISRDPSAVGKLFKEGKYPYVDRMERPRYEKEKAKLQIELLKVQDWVKNTGQKIVVICEGRDAAGKGSTIKRFMEHLNPRAAKVIALEKPSRREKGQWYFQRYVKHLPSRGEMLFLDRSWYNRAGVECVMGFCDCHEYLEFMRQCPEFERMLVRTGTILFKYWFSVTRKEQKKCFQARKNDPMKQWKMSDVDAASIGLWKEYTQAKEAMFFYTNTASCPWTIVKSDDKKRARLNCMQDFLLKLDYPNKNKEVVVGPDPLVVGSPAQVLREDLDFEKWPFKDPDN